MAKFYKPQNEKGHNLVPVVDTNTSSTEFIHKSWLNTIANIPNSDGSDNDKIVTGEALKATYETLIKSGVAIQFNTQYDDFDSLYKAYSKITEQNWKMLASTIFLIKSTTTGENDVHSEYVCTNATEENAKLGTVDPKWEKIGTTAPSIADASNTTAGIVKLSDSTDGTETATSGKTAATPKAVADAKNAAIDAAKEYSDGKLASVVVSDGANDVTLNTTNSKVTFKGDKTASAGHITVTADATSNTVTVSSDIVDASTSAKGIVQLVDSISDGDTESSKAATPKAVADALNSKLGSFTISDNQATKGSLTVDTTKSTLDIIGSEHISVTVNGTDNKITISDNITNASTTTAGIIKIVTDLAAETAKTDNTSAVTPKAVLDAIDAAVKADIQDAIDEAVEDLEEKLEEKLAQAHETVLIDVTINNGKATINRTRDEQFIMAIDGSEVFIPDVTIGTSSIELKFYDGTGIDNKSIKVLVSRKIDLSSTSADTEEEEDDDNA